jgi:release factor glutamine methyltransferase
MQLPQIKNIFVSELQQVYDSTEAVNLMWWAIQEITSKPKKELLVSENIEVSPEKITEVVSLLKSGKPIQYIFNKAYFFDLEFYVDEHVLIPRPETEELVQWIISDHSNAENISIIDLCTGSGCIAISLKNNLPHTKVSALDVSEEAIEIATKNAVSINLEIDFVCNDLFKLNTTEQFDIIVSNPPYVCEKEKALMHKNVLDHEPHIALFVDDALIFYKVIAKFGLTNLKPAGIIYLEINESLAKETADIFIQFGYHSTEIRNDLNGKERMIRVTK